MEECTSVAVNAESDFENDLESNATNDAQLMSNLMIRGRQGGNLEERAREWLSGRTEIHRTTICVVSSSFFLLFVLIRDGPI